MADKFVFSNFAVSTLRDSVGANTTSFNINVDDVGRFPTLTTGAKFPLVLADDDDNVEIVYVTSLTGGGVASVERARESTQARSWLAGTLLRHTLTAASLVGATGFRPRGAWNSAVTYEPGDVVTSAGISYIAVNTNVNSAPSGENINWQVVYQPPGVASTAMAWAGRWNSTTTYSVGQVVEYGGRLWQALIASTNSLPTISNANWIHIAKWSGAAHFQQILVLAGTNNYTAAIAAGELPSSMYDGLTTRVRVANNNTGPATLQLGSWPAYPWRKRVGVDFASGELVVGELYDVTWSEGGGEFITSFAPSLTRHVDRLDAAIAALAVLPTGTVLPFAATTLPGGFLLCDGQAVSRTTYSALFALLGTFYGTGDGSTTFNIPDLRGRVIAAADNLGGTAANRLPGYAFGSVGGASTHTLVTGEIPSHNHALTDPGHTHPATVTDPGHTHPELASDNVAGNAAGGTGVAAVDVGATTGASTTGITVSVGSNTTGITLAAAGGGGAHNNVQPTMALSFIIKT